MWITALSTTSYVNQKCLQTPPSVPWTAKPPAAGDRWWSLPESQHVGTGGFIGGSWRSRFAQTCLPGPAQPWCCWSPFSLILVWASVETDTVSSAVQAVRSLGVDPPAVGSLSPPLPIPLLRLPALYRRAARSPWGGCSRLFWFKKLPFFFSTFFQSQAFQPFPSLALHPGLPLIVALHGAGLRSHLAGLTCSRWSSAQILATQYSVTFWVPSTPGRCPFHSWMVLGPVGRGLCRLPRKSYFSKPSFPPFCNLGFQLQINFLFSSILRLQVDEGVGLFSLWFYDCCFWYQMWLKVSVYRQLDDRRPLRSAGPAGVSEKNRR